MFDRFSLVVLLFATLCVCSQGLFAQQYRIEPFEVKPSPLFAELRAANIIARPEAERMAELNGLLDRHGIPFLIGFDAATCERIKAARAKLADQNTPVKLGTQLQSVGAEGAALSLPSPTINTEECGGCTVELPLLQVTKREFIAVVGGRNIKFLLPTNFHVNRVKLLDPADATKVKREWLVPFRATPIGVSYDENVLYLSLPDPALSELTLMVFGEGVFQLATRKEAEEGGKGKMLPAAGRSTERTVRFDRWGKSYSVAFTPACGS